MDIGILAEELNLTFKSAPDKTGNRVTGGYTGDLLSDVMANAKQGDVWITRQIHQNIVAVATLKELSGIILVNSSQPAKDTLEKAIQENIPILVSDLPAFEITGRIYDLLKAAK